MNSPLADSNVYSNKDRCATPFICTRKDYLHAYFALGFGGKGITFSQVAGKMISNHYSKKNNEHIKIFSFTRKVYRNTLYLL
ncbi:MAG: hypothetical protein ABI723_25745 [Bacteroidia bacterium]